IKIATGKSALGMDIDKEFNDAMSVTLTASLAKNGDTYAVTKTKTGDDAKYYEYGTGDTVEFSNPNGYHEIDKSGSASVSTLSSQLKESDMLKMTLASNPENFMPLSGSSEIGAFTKDDVESFDYKYDAAAKEKTLTFQLKASAIDKAMDTVDVKAMQAKPATMDAGFATITMTFNSVVLTYETVSVEMKINADGYMTALETKFATNKSASSLDVGVTLLGNMKSDTLDAALTTVYTFEKIGSTEKPAKPF
ncbi:MAG: hypothetical protein LIO46_07550, partial [Clostridiales bacterium]|nr:hypothetical protein [Clostridiales bacterium]